jgi:hypothetical protein
VTHLNANGLIDDTFGVTDLGKEFLATVVIPIDSTEASSKNTKKGVVRTIGETLAEGGYNLI